MNNGRINLDYLPPKACELEPVIGLPALLKLVEWRPAVTLYVPSPAMLTHDHPIALALGMEAAIALAKRYGGTKLEVPRCDAAVRAMLHAEIRARRAAGESESAVARDVGMWPRSVRRICAADKNRNDDQGDLFR